MNFKEALIAHLNGDKVEVKRRDLGTSSWIEWSDSVVLNGIPVSEIVSHLNASLLEYRLAQRSIIVNGVEVPAPEKVAPVEGTEYYVPDIYADEWTYEYVYRAESDLHKRILERGLVYLNKEDAIARAKAMLIIKEV